MPGSKRTFEYSLKAVGPDEVERTYRKAEKILAWACDGDPRVECHGISGESLGVVTLNVTVVGRDQWATRQIVQDILNLITWGLGQPDDLELDLKSERLPPHMTRGYGVGGRTKTWRETRPRM